MESGDVGKMAGDLMDPGHRLPGEIDSESSPLLEDAEHWLHVYRELLTFKRTLLRTAEIHEEGAPDAVVSEVSDDQALLRAELDRLEQRHDFWARRARQLQSR
jgi:hypothetical protein